MMVWTKEYAVGDEVIDQQHQELFRRVNTLLAAAQNGKAKDEIRETIEFLSEYVIEHFSFEEQEMTLHQYPKEEAHRREHASFVAEVALLKELLLNRGPSHALALSAQQRLVTWLKHHIIKVDTNFGAFLATR